MKSKIILIFSFIILINFTFVSASFQTTINLFEENQDSLEKISNQDLLLEYYFNTGEEIKKNIQSDDITQIDLDKELFCFEGCNIVPERTIYRTDIYKDNELISRIEDKNNDFQKNSLINIYLTKKIQDKLDRTHEEGLVQSNPPSNKEKAISWKGSLIINDEGEYDFKFDVTGNIKVILDEEIVLDSSDSDEKQFGKYLDKGNYTIYLDYTTDIKSEPNLLYKGNLDSEFTVFPKNNLIFIEGYINEYEESAKSLSIASTFPESYEIDYSTYPTAVLGYYSNNSDRTPLLLIHGLHGSDDINVNWTSTWDYWNLIPYQLTDLDYDVWELYYIPANVSNFMTSGLLKNEIEEILSLYTTSKLDVVSHSMGGFVTLGYIEGLGKTSNQETVVYGNNIRNYVIIASPLHGSFSANRVLLDIAPASYGCNWLANILGVSPDDEYAQAYLDLAVGSEFTWLLNKNDLNEDINYLVITGNEGIGCVPDETREYDFDEPGDGNDGLVAVSSASLLDKGVPLVVLDDYNHANERGIDWTGFFTVNTQKEVDIINDFIQGNNIEEIKSNLNNRDYYIDPNNESTNPFGKGSVVIKINSDENINEVYLEHKTSHEKYFLTKFTDNLHETNTNNWFYFSNDNQSMYYPTQDYDNLKYGLTLPKGQYYLYINGQSYFEDIEIKGAQTTMSEIYFYIPEILNNSLIEWENYFSIVDYNSAYSVKQTQGGYIVAGNKGSSSLASDTGIFLLKTDYSGEILWQRYFHGLQAGYGYADTVHITSDEGYIIIGMGDDCNSTIIKTNKHGLEEWNITFKGEGISVVETSDGSYFATGDNCKGGRNDEVRVIKISHSGNLIWQKDYGLTEHDDWSSSIQETSDGNLLIGGITQYGTGGFMLLKIDKEGVIKAIKSYSGAHFGGFAIETLSNEYVISGTNSDGYIVLIKTNSNLDTLWRKTYRIFGGGEVYSLTPTREGGIAVGGYSVLNYSDEELLIFEVNNDGKIEWYKTIDDSGTWWDSGNSISNTSDGGFIVAGEYTDMAEGKVHIALIKIRGDEEICSPELTNTTWSEWQNISCLENNKMNQSRFLVQYDYNNCGEIQNETLYEFQEVLDCGILEENVTTLIINSPNQLIYNERRIPLSIQTTDEVDEIVYSYLDSRGNERERTLCRDCNEYDREMSFSSGFNDVTFKGIIDDEVIDEKKVNFTIDYRDPRIRGTEPRRGYANGDFFVEYSEDNPKELLFHYGNDAIGMRMKNITGGCESDDRGNILCMTSVNLSDYQGQEIGYWFEVFDIANNSDESREEELIVDNIAPIINSAEYYSDGRSDYIRVEFVEDYLDEIEYYENNDDRARWQSLCRRADNGICEGRVRLEDGDHNITIRAKDEAGSETLYYLTGFFTDSRDPRIRGTEPRRGYANGEFIIEYEEANLKEIILHYGNSLTGQKTNNTPVDCYKDDRDDSFCNFVVDLTDYHGQEIMYWFEVVDIANNTDTSREIDLDVDIVDPVLNDFDYVFDGRRIEFLFNITEENFDEITYLDLNDERGRERRLCSRLRDGICETRKSFRYEDYNLRIDILDEAGNSADPIFLDFTCNREQGCFEL